MGYARGGNVYHSFYSTGPREDWTYTDLDFNQITFERLLELARPKYGKPSHPSHWREGDPLPKDHPLASSPGRVRVGYCKTGWGEGSSCYAVQWGGLIDPEIPAMTRRDGVPSLDFYELPSGDRDASRFIEVARVTNPPC